MKKFKYIFLLILLYSGQAIAQSMDSLGQNNNAVLNKDEAAFLNAYISSKDPAFDFSNKKIVFVTGSGGTSIITKQQFFNSVRAVDTGKIVTAVFPFTATEKIQSGGYDAVVTSWVKVLMHRKKLIKRLGKED